MSKDETDICMELMAREIDDELRAARSQRAESQGRQVIDKLLLRPKEAAEAIGVSRSKIYQLLATNEIPNIRVGSCIRVPVAALKAWIQENTTEPLADEKKGRRER